MQDADVAVNVDTQLALAELDGFVGIVNGAAGTVNIDGNPQAAGTALVTVLGQIAAGQGTVTINGQALPAQAALSMIVGQIGASGATVTINGQSVPAQQVLTTTLDAIARGQGTVTINGQSLPAQGVLSAIVGTIGRSNGAVTINANDLATRVINAIPKNSTHTVTIRTVGRVAVNPSGGLQAYAHGGIAPAQRFHDGGVAVARMAMGGSIPRPFTAGRAQVFPPRMLRITGDRTDVDEFYLPDNSARRSMSLGREWARRRGMELVPRAMAAAAGPGAAGAAAPGSGGATSGGRAGVGMAAPDAYRQAMTQVRVSAPTSASALGVVQFDRMRAELSAKLDGVATSVAAAVREARPITVEGGRDPEGVARRTQLALRLG
jgi:hypothetical protein